MNQDERVLKALYELEDALAENHGAFPASDLLEEAIDTAIIEPILDRGAVTDESLLDRLYGEVEED